MNAGSISALCMGLALCCPSLAQADEWQVTRLRGGVFVLTDGQWTQLNRGSIVSDERVIKSAPGGRATFVRDAETIEIGPDTTIQIEDAGGFTTVYNHEGVVGIDAEARNVQHFAVQTAFLAAVVKGTAFVVRSDERHSTVAVTRGTVEVDDEVHDTSIDLPAGQEVSSGAAPITVDQVVPISRALPPPPTTADATATTAVQQDHQAPERGMPSTSANPGDSDKGNSGGSGTTGSGAGAGSDGDKGNNDDSGSTAGGNSNSGNGNGNGGGDGEGNGNNGHGGGNGKGNNGNGNGNGGSNGKDNNGNGKKD